MMRPGALLRSFSSSAGAGLGHIAARPWLWQRVCEASGVEFLRPQPGEGKASSRPGPVLRLVPQAGRGESTPTYGPSEPVPNVVAARRAIALENHLARGGCSPGEYETLSRAVAGALEGGRAAILTPERRKLLVAGAVSSGMRPFEAQLIVAAVQEAVRHGDVDPMLHGPLKRGESKVPQDVPHAHELEARRAIIVIAACLLLGVALMVALVRWTLGEGSAAHPTSAARGASR